MAAQSICAGAAGHGRTASRMGRIFSTEQRHERASVHDSALSRHVSHTLPCTEDSCLGPQAHPSRTPVVPAEPSLPARFPSALHWPAASVAQSIRGPCRAPLPKAFHIEPPAATASLAARSSGEWTCSCSNSNTRSMNLRIHSPKELAGIFADCQLESSATRALLDKSAIALVRTIYTSARIGSTVGRAGSGTERTSRSSRCRL